MEGFMYFTDVQVEQSLCFSLFWCGFIAGSIFSGVPYYLIKWFIKKLKRLDINI